MPRFSSLSQLGCVSNAATSDPANRQRRFLLWQCRWGSKYVDFFPNYHFSANRSAVLRRRILWSEIPTYLEWVDCDVIEGIYVSYISNVADWAVNAQTSVYTMQSVRFPIAADFRNTKPLSPKRLANGIFTGTWSLDWRAWGNGFGPFSVRLHLSFEGILFRYRTGNRCCYDFMNDIVLDLLLHATDFALAGEYGINVIRKVVKNRYQFSVCLIRISRRMNVSAG